MKMTGLVYVQLRLLWMKETSIRYSAAEVAAFCRAPAICVRPQRSAFCCHTDESMRIFGMNRSSLGRVGCVGLFWCLYGSTEVPR